MDFTPSVNFKSHSLLEDFGSSVSNRDDSSLLDSSGIFYRTILGLFYSPHQDFTSNGSDLNNTGAITTKGFSNFESSSVDLSGLFVVDFNDLRGKFFRKKEFFE